MDKHTIQPDKVIRLLTDVMTEPVRQVTPVRGGERTDVYAFVCDGRDFIVRFSSQRQGFDKDRYAFEHFGKTLPIPEILHVGDFDTSSFAISRKLPGKVLERSDKLDGKTLGTLDAIRSIPVDPMAGYGWFDEHGVARYGTWQAWVTKPFIMVKKPGGDMYTWKEVLTLPFVGPPFIHQLVTRINQLLKFVPPEKHIIHGDFGPGNILIDSQRVSGVLDWNEAAYGDFLYDVAYLDFWSDNREFMKAVVTHYKEEGITEPHFTQRVHCHQLFAGLTALGIYAALKSETDYREVEKRIREKLIGKNGFSLSSS